MAKGKIIIILGKTCSGKTTFAKKMSEMLGIKRVVTYTSRPMRDGEEEGVDYNFVSHDYMSVNRKHFIGLNSYVVEPYGNCYYGVFKPDLELDEHVILVVEPSGYYQIKSMYGDRVVGLYIMAKESDLYGRYVAREPDNSFSRIEAKRRLARDREDFYELEYEVDHLVVNNYYLPTIEKIHTILLKELTGEYIG